MIDDYAQAMELIRKMEAHLPMRVDPRHLLAQEIRAYQRERTRRLAQSGGPREPSHFTVRPRKKRWH